MSQEIWLGAFKSATIHYHSSRGCKTVTCQSWRSKKVKLPRYNSSQASQIYLIRCSLEPKMSDFHSDLQLWQVTVLQPFNPWWCIVSLLKAPISLWSLLKNSIPVLWRHVIMAQSNPILLHTVGNGCIFFWLAVIQIGIESQKSGLFSLVNKVFWDWFKSRILLLKVVPLA